MKIAVYPGSFDPLTNGHLDIIERASSVFDKLIVAISINTTKKTMFTLEERKAMIEVAVEPIKNVEVVIIDGLLVDYVKSLKDAVIVRGLRAISDFEMEFQMALMNRDLAPEVETMFLMTTHRLSFLSSTMIKEVDKFGGDISGYVPPNVYIAMKEKRG